MHQKKSELQIGKESNNCISSDYYNTKNLKHPQLQTQNQSQSNHQNATNNFTINPTHLTVQIPPPIQQTNQIFFQHEPFSNNNPSPSSLTQPFHLASTTPHKRPIMIQSQTHQTQTQTQALSSSVNNRHHHIHYHNTKVLFWLTSCASAITPFARKLCHNVSHACLLRFQFRFLILISLPSLYFFIYNPRRFFLFTLLSIFAFSLTLLVSVNLALPRLPSLRLLLARSLPNNFITSFSLSKPPKPVVWSIGSKPKTEKMSNSGCWVQVYSNGDVYEGEFHKGKCSGSGVFYYSMKGKYEGDWIDEKYDGYGVETWARGSRYRGQYRQGLRHGIGVYRFYTGDVYAGEWSNGQCHGGGIHTCEDGSRYIGEFKWGVKHGLGHYHFRFLHDTSVKLKLEKLALVIVLHDHGGYIRVSILVTGNVLYLRCRNGDTYAGEYFADKMHGFGIYLFGNGHRYEGAWHEGRRQGLGMYTFRNGETQSGHWQNGILDVPSSENIHPGSPFAVSHPKVLNTVKEARQAAEKAYNVAKVDERVNKAVAAANKAANAARVAAVKAVQKRTLHNNGDDMSNSIV